QQQYSTLLDPELALSGGLAMSRWPQLTLTDRVSPTATDQDLLQWLEPTLDELGLTSYPRGSEDVEDAAVRIMASRLLAGALSPRELARWTHSAIGHDGTPHAEELVMLDDVYDMLEYCEETEAEIDARVLAEARRLTAAGVATQGADSPA
ncbi:hypothetical protein ACFY2Q_10830, partial [Micromonospora sp. NPDC000316]|uniref:hypothetical protein n=1 Tax=Micromonospora sp. NPDC000316 TaxID=3364216 RepID=UPI0036C8409C